MKGIVVNISDRECEKMQVWLDTMLYAQRQVDSDFYRPRSQELFELYESLFLRGFVEPIAELLIGTHVIPSPKNTHP